MSRELLGDTLDIHTGGIDHIPVHHTNEIAQSEALIGKPFANIWVHANHLKVNGTKISKSLGNGFTLQDIKDKGFDIEAFKLMVLSKHYRTEGNFTWEILEASQNRLGELRAWADLRYQSRIGVMPEELDKLFSKTHTDMLAAVQDDLNTPKALVVLSMLVNYMIAIPVLVVEEEHMESMLRFIDDLLGLSLSSRPDITPDEKKLIGQREAARTNKDFTGSDTLRNELSDRGIVVRDTINGSIWSRK